jgi:peroxiredoxin
MTHRWIVPGLVVALAAGILSAYGQQPPTDETATLKVGDMAPDFTLPDQNLKQVKLSDFRGKQNVVLAFYFLAFTGGWTREVQNYRDNLEKFREFNAQVLGISVDSPFAQKEFAKQNSIEYPLLSDLKKEVSRQYGVLLEDRGVSNRVTLVIDKEGKVRSIEGGNSAISVNGALAALQALQWGSTQSALKAVASAEPYTDLTGPNFVLPSMPPLQGSEWMPFIFPRAPALGYGMSPLRGLGSEAPQIRRNNTAESLHPRPESASTLKGWDSAAQGVSPGKSESDMLGALTGRHSWAACV